MRVARWRPFHQAMCEADRLHEEMSLMFGRFGSGERRAARPPLDLRQDEENLYLEAELPGLAREDLEITVSGEDELTVRGERKPPEHEGAAWHRRERDFGAFERTVALPCPVDAEKVSATMRHGVLTVTLPKAAAARPRKIDVKAE